MTKVLVGLFDDFTAALNTTADLVSAGVPREDVSVVANDGIAGIEENLPPKKRTISVTK